MSSEILVATVVVFMMFIAVGMLKVMYDIFVFVRGDEASPTPRVTWYVLLSITSIVIASQLIMAISFLYGMFT